jgi:hypothetical protein
MQASYPQKKKIKAVSWPKVSESLISSKNNKFYVKAFVVHLFLNVVYQEQDNIIVNYNRPSSSEALSPHGYNVHQTKVKKDIPSSFNT